MPELTWVTAVSLIALGLFAGWLGAVVGIGGGVVIVPILVLGFGYDIRIAVAASLVAVVATSTAAGSAYVGEGLANMRLGMSLEIATTVGGITGGLVAVLISPSAISAIFAVMMVITTVLVLRGRDEHGELDGGEIDGDEGDLGTGGLQGYEAPGRLAGAYVDHHRGTLVTYEAERLGVGSSISFVAGALSGLLGVGGGFLKVPAMNLGMKVPIKVAAATSNFMIGVTGIASLFVYFARGYLHPFVAAPLAVGVVVGALAGAHTSNRVSPEALRRLLAVVLLVVAVQMGLNAMGVDLGR